MVMQRILMPPARTPTEEKDPIIAAIVSYPGCRIYHEPSCNRIFSSFIITGLTRGWWNCR
ncbi:MAG: hypothetical protein FIB08_00945 [Candidatus Methanoperedens sp.]|nr:hypothetical protein [Candidatus Methanoperedens sp.]